MAETVEEFLQRPLTAHLATAGPRVRPVWFLWEDGAFWILTGPWAQAWRDVQRDPSVALVVDVCDIATGETKQVVVRGMAELLDWDPDRGWRMLRRYLGPDVETWEPRFKSYLSATYPSSWLRLPAPEPKLVDLSFVPSLR